MPKTPGRQVIDISPLLGVFEAQEGEVQQIIGKTGMGKTYEATRRALNYLQQGYVVYTTWRLNLPDYYDEREHFWPVLRNLILRRKNFFRFNYKENWKYVDLQDFESKAVYEKEGVKEQVLPKSLERIKELEAEGYVLKERGGIIDTEALAIYLATRTDCIFMLDEGQDVFDSNKKSGQIARQSITRTRHMHKTLILISQRAQAVDVNVRANCTYFYMCVKRNTLLFPTRFRVYRTDDVDESSNYPIWVRHNSQGEITWQAPIWHSGFAKKYIYDAYDSWYMRQNMIRSQDIKIDAYELTTSEKFLAMGDAIFGKKEKKEKVKKVKEVKEKKPFFSFFKRQNKAINKDKIELSTPKKLPPITRKKKVKVE